MNLVTGATGHIGNVLVKELVKQGESVRVLLLPGEDLEPLRGLDIEIYYGNVLDVPSLEKALAGVTNVFHLAGIISIAPGKENLIHQVNVEGTKNIMNVALRCGVKRFVYTSSIHAFKRIPHGLAIDEKTPIDPACNIAAYDRSKAEATLAVLEMVKSGLPAVIVCPTGVIGPCDYKKSEMGSVLCGWMSKRVNYMINGSYDFVDVRDVVAGIIMARDRGEVGQLYILSGHLVSVVKLWTMVKEFASPHAVLINIPVKIARTAAVLAEQFYKLTHSIPKFTRYSVETLQSNAVINNSKAQEVLGYRARPIQETLRDTIDWWNHTPSFSRGK